MDKIQEAFHIALANLTANAARSILSIMGVVIGIAAVITILSIGAGAKERILQQMNAMGVNVFNIYARYDEQTQRMGQLELADVERIEQLPFVITAFPELSLYKTVRSRAVDSRGAVSGIDPTYLTANEFKIVEGRSFSPIEIEERAAVCLLNDDGESLLYPGEESAVGQTAFVDGSPWTVIGVVSRDTGRRRKHATRGDENVEIYAPLKTLIRSVKDAPIQSIVVHVKSGMADRAEIELTDAMERDDANRKGLFTVRDQKDFYSRSLEIQKLFSLIGTLVAGVSLIVGGIGMMNVMLTSVAERTREIGIRRAVGGRKKDILFQFLIESCVLSGVGGMLGLLMGAALARGLPLLFKQFFTIAPRIQPSFLVISVGTGVLLGVVFGFYPAIKASKLSPAEALRTE